MPPSSLFISAMAWLRERGGKRMELQACKEVERLIAKKGSVVGCFDSSKIRHATFMSD